jgi:hypothetical protein
VRLSWSNRRWQLLLPGGEVLKDFGGQQVEALQALRLIQQLGLNQHGTVGTQAPILEYWLHDGQAPHRVGGPLHVLPLGSAGLRVEEVKGQWCLRDARRVLFNFGDQAADAHQALAVLRKYGFTQVGVLGQGRPSMLVLLAPAGTAAPGEGIVPTAAVSAAAAAAVTSAAPGPASGASSEPAPAAAPGAAPWPTVAAPDRWVPSTGRHLAEPRFARQKQMPASAATPSGAAPSPLADLVSPSVPTLAPPAPAKQGFAWRTTPHFGPATAARGPATAARVPFDWRQVHLRHQDGGWSLRAGSMVLASFGDNESEARQALMAMRHYRFTEQWRIGGDRPFTYFLANGQAPRGLMLGLGAQGFQPETLVARQVAGHWSLCDGDRVVVQLGNRPDEVRNLLEIIKRNRFDRLCQVGVPAVAGAADSPAPGSVPAGISFLVRSR